MTTETPKDTTMPENQPAVGAPVEPTVRHQPLPDELLWELAKAAANTEEGSGKLHYDCDKAWAREFARLVVVEALAERRSLPDEQVLMMGRRAMDKCLGTEAQHLYIAREVERAHGVEAERRVDRRRAMTSVQLTVESCKVCPFMRADRLYTPDSFEFCFTWKCSKNHDAVITSMDWNDKVPPIPKWCPLRSAL